MKKIAFSFMFLLGLGLLFGCWISSPPDTDNVTVFLKESYHEKFLDREFTTADLNYDNVKSFGYFFLGSLEDLNRFHPFLRVSLAKTGQYEIERATNHFSKMEYAEDIGRTGGTTDPGTEYFGELSSKKSRKISSDETVEVFYTNPDGFNKEGSRVDPDSTGFHNRVMIPNSKYYTTIPKHGRNSNGTCGEVASQLILSYHNYYSDRRIIDNDYLFGSNDPNNVTERNMNPNYSSNPLLMTSNTLGSTQEYHNYLFNNFVHIGGGGTLHTVRDGIRNELNHKNLSFNINYHGVLFGAGVIASVSPTGIVSEIDSGRPVVLTMANNLGASSNHFVVAYGYQFIGSTFGYIVHYGWDSVGREFCWVNADWISGYVSLEILH